MCPTSCCRTGFAADESGATMLEYGFLLLFVALVATAAVKLLGQNILPLFCLGSYLYNQGHGQRHQADAPCGVRRCGRAG